MRFNKRVYGSCREFLKDVRFAIRNRKRIKRVMKKGLVPAAFRERLMIVVTAVYGCRYCSWAHTREALRSGLSREEIANLFSGSIEDCHEEEAIALLYAQHWAESNAKPIPESVQRLEQAYGAEKVEAVNLVLHMIRLGNLLGNSLDYLLYRVSFGKWRR